MNILREIYFKRGRRGWRQNFIMFAFFVMLLLKVYMMEP